jgi:CDP-paratose 2-epimerase
MERCILITGGAGFIGANLAHRLASQGNDVLLLDNLSREGVRRNVEWLQSRHGGRVRLLTGDVRSPETLARAVRQAEQVFHFAAQVAVTTSLTDARLDFETNALGTFNLLQALRAEDRPIPLLYTSTNKVYGALQGVEMVRHARRWRPSDEALLASGINESRSLDFHSPYGCSKGAADQYVLDHARCFGMPATVFRMSCIYGPHQFGTEDQGWVAHFLIRALAREPITIYGDGYQVRDILFVEDLVDAFLLAMRNIDRISGTAFNIGGGVHNTVSLAELLDLMGELLPSRAVLFHEAARTGDQLYYVSDTRRFESATGWRPRVGVQEGIRRLFAWLGANRAVPVAEHAGVLS